MKERNPFLIISLIILNIPPTLISNLNMLEAQMLTIAEIHIKIRNSKVTTLEYLTFLTPRFCNGKSLNFEVFDYFPSQNRSKFRRQNVKNQTVQLGIILSNNDANYQLNITDKLIINLLLYHIKVKF